MESKQIETQIMSFKKSDRNDKYEMIEFWEQKLRDQEILKYNQTIEARTNTKKEEKTRIESMSWADYQDMVDEQDDKTATYDDYKRHMRSYYTQDNREVPSRWV